MNHHRSEPIPICVHVVHGSIALVPVFPLKIRANRLNYVLGRSSVCLVPLLHLESHVNELAHTLQGTLTCLASVYFLEIHSQELTCVLCRSIACFPPYCLQVPAHVISSGQDSYPEAIRECIKTGKVCCCHHVCLEESVHIISFAARGDPRLREDWSDDSSFSLC